MRFLLLSVVLVAAVLVGPSSAGTAMGEKPPPMRFEGTVAPSAYDVVSDGERYVAFEVRKGERQLTRIIDTRERERFRVEPPAGCSGEFFWGAGLVAVGGGNVLWNCLPDPGELSSHNNRRNAWLFDLSDRKFRLAAGMDEMRACHDSYEWVGVGSRWLEVAVGEHSCRGSGDHYLDHRTGEVVGDQYPPRSDQVPDLDADVPLQPLCSGVRRTITQSEDRTYWARAFQFENGFGIGTLAFRSALRLQRCDRSPVRVDYCKDHCSDIQLGKRFLTWRIYERGVYAYSLATGEITRWAIPGTTGAAQTRNRIFVVLDRSQKVHSAALPRP